ncbi:MFS transporter [Caulobacter sp. CCUG 60055]|uniref:peptide MFS transporter n=1 Tax=Caulobacter sp. CCUG 60055 TaxID=2100090 RepID=UPI001FA772E2|nr:peptide MFS transporter [Caulobacter sp. CCUG 60055]MCI3179496.1 MFS transporter [Caulobacter sp. CCUG 60055]
MSEVSLPSSREPTWFGHPRGLTILFLTEMWEIFSYYGMRALLVYYMTKQLLLGQAQASMVYGLYTATVYLTPIVGGVISDRWLGRRRSVILGGSIMALGHFMMASESLFYPALAVIALGNGLFMPSLPSQVVGLYRPDDPRRGSAFNLYYVGINLGALLAPLVCGTLGETFGWHWGFAAAGVGMAGGLAIYVAGARYLPPEPLRAADRGRADEPPPGDLARRLWLLAGVAATVVIFRVAYEQLGNTVALWADQGVDRHVGGWTIPMTWFQSLNPLLVFALTPVLVARWTDAARRGREPSSIVKMAIGAAVVGASFLLLGAVDLWTGGARASWVWLAVFFAVLTVGELYILPVGMGLFGRLAPPRIAATTIAVWCLALFAGNLAAGVVGVLWGRMPHGQYFLLMAAFAGASSLILLLFDRPAQRVEAGAATPGTVPVAEGAVS